MNECKPLPGAPAALPLAAPVRGPPGLDHASRCDALPPCGPPALYGLVLCRASSRASRALATPLEGPPAGPRTTRLITVIYFPSYVQSLTIETLQ